MIEHEDQDPNYQSIYQREAMEEEMEKIRENIIENLTALERAALFQEYDEFWYLYKQEAKNHD